MKKITMFLGILSIFVVAACNQNQENKTAAPPAGNSETTTRVDTVKVKVKEDGTTIKIGDDGVSFGTKDGGKESNIKISRDSTSIEIKKPK